MTATVETTTAHPSVDPTRPTLARASEIITIRHLVWLAPTWVFATLAYSIVIGGVARWGSVDESLWQSVVAGWQRWIVLVVGVSTTTTMLRLLVRNGATRSLLSSASTVAMAVIAVVAALWITAGYAVEKLIYERYGWTQTVTSGAVFTWPDLWRVALETSLVLCAYFITGWLAGLGFYRYGVVGGLLFLIPALVPAASSELFASRDFGGIDIDVLGERFGRPHLAVSVVGGLVVVAAGAWVARRLTHGTPLR